MVSRLSDKEKLDKNCHFLASYKTGLEYCSSFKMQEKTYTQGSRNC